MALISVDVEEEGGWYSRDQESSRELFYLGLIHELFWLPTDPWPSPEVFTRTWVENRAEYDRLVQSMKGGSFDSLLDYCSSRSISPTRSMFPAFPFWLPPRGSVAEDKKEQVKGKLRRELLAKYGNECQVCHGVITGSFHAHHIIPRSLGGPTSLSNLVPLHANCHANVEPWVQNLLSDES